MNKEIARTSCCSIGDGLCVWGGGGERTKSVKPHQDWDSRLTYAYLQVSRTEYCAQRAKLQHEASLPQLAQGSRLTLAIASSPQSASALAIAAANAVSSPDASAWDAVMAIAAPLQAKGEPIKCCKRKHAQKGS